MKSYELEGFVLGRKKCPPIILDNGVVNKNYMFWYHQDQMIAFLLIVSINDDLIKEVSNYVASTKNWCALKNSFTIDFRARIFQIKFKSNNIKKKIINILEYVAKIKEIVWLLAKAGYSIHGEDQVHAILNGLNYDYDMVLATFQSKI